VIGYQAIMYHVQSGIQIFVNADKLQDKVNNLEETGTRRRRRNHYTLR